METDLAEQWRQIPGWPYAISNRGRVRRTRASHVTPAGFIKSPTLRPDGYLVVRLHDRGRVRGFLIHILLCEAFKGPRPSPDHEVAHWNGRRADNRLRNLRWATSKENAEDSRRHGTMVRGECATGAKLTAKQVTEIRTRVAGGAIKRRLAMEYGVCPSQIGHIVKGRRWRHVV